MKGRKPKSVADKIMTGNPGKRPMGETQESNPFVCEPPCKPAGLSERESNEWDRLTYTLAPILSRSAEGMLLIAVQAFAQMMEADEAIKAHGLTYVTTTKEGADMIRQRPEVGMRDRARRQYQQALAELGASPVAQTRVKKLPNGKKPILTGTAQFFTS